MNRRQKKKRCKQKYGCNPPKEWNGKMEPSIKQTKNPEIAKILKNAIARAMEIAKRVFECITKALQNCKEKTKQTETVCIVVARALAEKRMNRSKERRRR